MDSNRIKEIQETTSHPDSVSVQQALLQVWNECEQEYNNKNKNNPEHGQLKKQVEDLKIQLEKSNKFLYDLEVNVTQLNFDLMDN